MAERRADWCSRVDRDEEAYIAGADVRTWTGTGVTDVDRRGALRTWTAMRRYGHGPAQALRMWTDAGVTDVDGHEALWT